MLLFNATKNKAKDYYSQFSFTGGEMLMILIPSM